MSLLHCNMPEGKQYLGTLLLSHQRDAKPNPETQLCWYPGEVPQGREFPQETFHLLSTSCPSLVILINRSIFHPEAMLRKNLIKYIPNKMLEIWEQLCETFLGPWSPLSKSQIAPFPVSTFKNRSGNLFTGELFSIKSNPYSPSHFSKLLWVI